MTEFSLVWRGSANTWECDEMGHMNVRFYLAKAGDALAVLAYQLGLGPANADGLMLAAVDQHVRYQREVRAGTPLSAYAGITHVRADRLQVYMELRRSIDNTISASFLTELICVRANGRSQQAIPQTVIEAAKARLTILPEHGAPKGLDLHPPREGVDLTSATELGLAEIYLGSVQPAQVDEHGFMLPYHFTGFISDGVSNFFTASSPERARARAEGKVGGAALEYRFVYRKPARIGDIVTVRSGYMGATDKVQKFCHWILDRATGEALATCEVVAVMFDLVARKIIPLPDDVRAEIEAMKVESLSA
jgi:acyl-CoA thioester hydrolase